MAKQGIEPHWVGTKGPRFVERPAHRRWLLGQATELIDFFQFGSFNPAGGFFPLDDAGRPFPAAGASGVVRQIHDTTRTVHCFAIAHLLGLPGADRMIDHGMEFLWNRHRDAKNGGYFWGVDDQGATDPKKQAYGHAFVLLAASSAKVVGHPGRRPAARGCHRSPADAVLGGRRQGRPARNTLRTGPRSAAIAGRTRTCI